jgi:asparagine synthase (glutamine-hydrolysing)
VAIYQASDWHESLTHARGAITAELDRLASCPSAAKTLDLTRLKTLVDYWPRSGWANSEVVEPYRHALLRGISAGHFQRKAAEVHR